MAYRISYAPDAGQDLDYEGRATEASIRRAVPRYLTDQPGEPSNMRRPLDPNPLEADWELRLGNVRVFYQIDNDAQTVRVLRVGRKAREVVYLRGRPFEMRFQ